MVDINTVFQVILYILASILLVVLIVLVIRVMGTLKKVDSAIEDYNEKSKKLDGLFEIIDSTTDTISSLSDRIVSSVINGISNLFTRKKRKDNEDE